MNQDPYELDIDEHLKIVRAPVATVKHGVTKEMAGKILWHLSEPVDINSNGCDMVPGIDYPEGLIDNPYHATAVIDALARSNDVASLRLILDEAIECRIGGPEENLQRDITYAVAHMLVDGSGNEPFAREWLENFGHTRSRAAGQMKELLDRHSKSAHDTQTLLGTAILSEPFKEYLITGATPSSSHIYVEAPFASFMDGLALKSIPEKGRDAALLLKLMHPDQLPDLERSNGAPVPLAHMLWSADKITLNRALQAASEAYDPDNEAVNTQMRDGIACMLRNQAIPLPSSFTATDESPIVHHPVWKALDHWGGPDIGKRVWGSLTTGMQKFLEELVSKADERDSIAILDFMKSRGADFDDPIRMDQNGPDDIARTNLALIAVAHSKAKVLGHLLGHDVDVDDVALHPKTKIKISAAELAEKMHAGARNPDYEQRTDAVASLMRTHLAKREALRVIAELDEPTQHARP